MKNTLKKAFLLISIVSLLLLLACSSEKLIENTQESEVEETPEVEIEETPEVELEQELPPITGTINDHMFLGEWKNTDAYGVETHIIFEDGNTGQFINEETTFTFDYTLVSQKLLRIDATSGELFTDETLQKFTSKQGGQSNKNFKFKNINSLTIDDVVWEKVDTTIKENSYKDKINPCTTC